MRRIVVLLLALATLPLMILHEGPGPVALDAPVVRTDLMPGLRRDGAVPSLGALQLVGAWQLRSRYRGFGNFSALATFADGTMVALSDRNDIMFFTRPDRPGPWRVWMGVNFHGPWTPPPSSDVEAVAVEPATQDLVMASEGAGEIYRVTRDLKQYRRIAIPELDEWPANMGPEAMALLHDGRLVMIGETYAGLLERRLHPALLFPGLPRPHQRPDRFMVRMPYGFRPVELAQLPDGRLLVLGREFGLGGFRTTISLADPAAIRPGAVVPTHEIARITDPRLRDNYEGMTVTRDADGSLAVWLISDSNLMAWLQRTLLLKLRFNPS